MANTLTNIVKADAKPFPLIADAKDETRSEPLSQHRDSQLEIDSRIYRQIDALTPYVDLARMARERYNNTPSMQNGSRMGEKVGVLKTRIKDMIKSIPMSESEIWGILRRRYHNIDEILGEVKETEND